MSELRGSVSRRCADCELTVSVQRPPRAISVTTGAKQRKLIGRELRAQVLWDALCPSCREAWNTLIAKCEEGIPKQINDQQEAAA
jgi:hypothetical protein